MSLTEDWKIGNLIPKQPYYCKVKYEDKIKVLYFTLDTNKQDEVVYYLSNAEKKYHRNGVREVLAPCDYDELQRLNQVIDSQQQTNHAMGKKLVKIFNLLKECQKYLNPSIESDRVIDCEGRDLLTRINAAVDEEKR